MTIIFLFVCSFFFLLLFLNNVSQSCRQKGGAAIDPPACFCLLCAAACSLKHHKVDGSVIAFAHVTLFLKPVWLATECSSFRVITREKKKSFLSSVSILPPAFFSFFFFKSWLLEQVQCSRFWYFVIHWLFSSRWTGGCILLLEMCDMTQWECLESPESASQP